MFIITCLPLRSALHSYAPTLVTSTSHCAGSTMESPPPFLDAAAAESRAPEPWPDMTVTEVLNPKNTARRRDGLASKRHAPVVYPPTIARCLRGALYTLTIAPGASALPEPRGSTQAEGRKQNAPPANEVITLENVFDRGCRLFVVERGGVAGMFVEEPRPLEPLPGPNELVDFAKFPAESRPPPQYHGKARRTKHVLATLAQLLHPVYIPGIVARRALLLSNVDCARFDDYPERMHARRSRLSPLRDEVWPKSADDVENINYCT
ncbi:hypothetical protein DFH11DRAFT_1635445 [Phellopilus nigrolimitatus]|nr:hypothetical protein DFH11DRAFT_1635445 [Phellopilus nigrolimitatus]